MSALEGPVSEPITETDGNAYLEAMVAGSGHVRHLRHRHDLNFDDVDGELLEQAARWLRAVSYSALEGARKLEHLLASRSAP